MEGTAAWRSVDSAIVVVGLITVATGTAHVVEEVVEVVEEGCLKMSDDSFFSDAGKEVSTALTEFIPSEERFTVIASLDAKEIGLVEEISALPLLSSLPPPPFSPPSISSFPSYFLLSPFLSPCACASGMELCPCSSPKTVGTGVVGVVGVVSEVESSSCVVERVRFTFRSSWVQDGQVAVEAVEISSLVGLVIVPCMEGRDVPVEEIVVAVVAVAAVVDDD